MTKDEARKVARQKILSLSEAEKEWASGCITDEISEVKEFKNARKIFVYLNSPTEPNTEDIVGLSLGMEKEVGVPKVRGDEMDAIIITPFTNFKTNKWGILEPVARRQLEEVDVAIIPLIAFDGLNRLGHGRGYYDRYLSTHDCFKIGIAFDCQCIEGLEVEDNDIPLDMLITEKRVITKDGETINKYML